MEIFQKKAVIKLFVVSGLALVVISAFSFQLDSAIPPLGGLLFPGNGVWDVPQGYPDQEGYSVDELNDEVTVYRDEWGIPHIYGSSMEDIAFAMGYTQAQDRLFFMDLARRFARGLLSEVLGPSMLANDIISKTKLLEYYANETYLHIKNSEDPREQEFYDHLLSFTAGINHYVSTHPDSLQLEFQLLDYEFLPWTVLDCIAIGFFMTEMTWEYRDLDRFVTMSHLIEEFGLTDGVRYFSELFGNPGAGDFLPKQVPINPGYGEFSDTPTFDNEDLKNSLKISKSVSSLSDGFNDLIEKVILSSSHERELLEYREDSGSNNWAVGGAKTESGKPLACSDSHGAWSLPNPYYETHFVDSSTGLNFFGYFVPGGAGVPLYGNSQYIASGMTTVQWDQCDWYYYNKVNDSHYIYNEEATEFQNIANVEIPIKGRTPFNLSIKGTVHGPVFSDLGETLPSEFGSLPSNFEDKVIAAKWYCHKVMDFTSVRDMAYAKNLTEFIEGLKRFESPSSSLNYADAEGNIGMFSRGDFPIRDDSNIPSWHLGHGFMPYNGSAGEGDWIETARYDENPKTINPESNYVVSANQLAAGPDYFDDYVGQFRYRPGYRARRLNEYITAKDDHTYKSMMQLHSDTKSIKAEDFVPHILDALDSKTSKTTMEKNVYDSLSEWDFMMGKDKAVPSIFATWMEYMEEETFYDEWEEYELTYRLFPEVSVIEELIRIKPNSHWFDDLDTKDKVETAKDIILLSLTKALSALEEYYETDDISDWIWGDIHQLEFYHMTGELDALNYGPVPYGGWKNTPVGCGNDLVQNGVFNPTNARRGAHHRLLTDFGNASNCYSVLPGGVSGLSTLGSPYNQFDLYRNGKYHTQHFTATTPQLFLDECNSLTSVILFKSGE